jgi:hypothetical protein
MYSLLASGAFAQTALPYQSGFDNPSQTAGWQKFRKGFISLSEWTFGTCFGAPSAPNCVSHDYPVGGATSKVVDWYVSPPFNFSGGGKVDSLAIKVFAMIGTPDADDHFGIYLLNGSADPALATVTQLADLTSHASSAGTWSTVGSYTIPPTPGTSYIAFKYTAQNNWFVPSLDNLKLSGTGGPTPCATPSNILFSNITSTGAKITWSNVTGASGYEYAVNTSATPPAAAGTPSTNLSETVNGLSSGTKYYAHTRAKCGTSFSAWKSLSFYTAFPASISDHRGEVNIHFYPNPVTDVLKITGLTPGMAVQLYDITGRLLLQQQAAAATIGIPTSGLPAGILVINITGEEFTYKARIVKQ